MRREKEGGGGRRREEEGGGGRRREGGGGTEKEGGRWEERKSRTITRGEEKQGRPSNRIMMDKKTSSQNHAEDKEEHQCY